MESVFLTMLEVSAASAVVILAVVALSSLINRSFTAKWKYWLWAVLAARLLIPFNPSFEAVPARVEVSIPAASVSLPSGFSAQPAQVTDPSPVQGQPVLPDASAPAASAAPAMTVVQLLMLAWLLGAVIFLLWQGAGYLRFRGRVRRWGLPVREDSPLDAVRQRVTAEMGITRKIPALICKDLSSPMMIGFFRPLLLLPHEEYDQWDLYYILRHELTHYKRRDIWYKALMLVANAVHWFNPAVWLMAREASRDLEISCDAAVMKDAGMEERRQYSEIILACVHRELGVRTALSTHFYGGKNALKERFANILSTRKRRAGLAAFAAVVACGGLIGGLVACSAEAPREDNKSDDAALLSPSVLGMGAFQGADAQALDAQPTATTDFLVARGTNETTVAPSQARIPNESDWAGEAQVREYQQILDNLDAASVSRFVMYSEPSDSPRQAALTRDQMAEFLRLLKSIRLDTVEPLVPYSGGTSSLHIVTGDDQLTLRHYGNILLIARRDQDMAWMFDGLSCADAIFSMDEMMTALLENAPEQPETPLYFGLGHSGQAQAMRTGDAIGSWRLESYDAAWDEAIPDTGVWVYDAAFTADAPVELTCQVTRSGFSREQYWFYPEEDQWGKLPVLEGDDGLIWFASANDAALGALEALGDGGERWRCRVTLDQYSVSYLAMEAFDMANIVRVEVDEALADRSFRTVGFSAAVVDMDGAPLGGDVEFSLRMPASWTVSGGSIYDEEGLLTAEVLPWIYSAEDGGWDLLDRRYPGQDPITDVRFGDLEGRRYGQSNTEMIYYIRRYDYLAGLKFYPKYGIGVGTQLEAFENRIRLEG